LDPSDSAQIKLPKQLKKKALTTFPRYLEIECWKRPELRGLEPVLQAVAEACKQINRIVQRAQTDDVYGVAVDSAGNPLEENVQGEVQQKLDVLCNTIMMQAFCGSSCNIHSVASEEEDQPRCCSDVMVRKSQCAMYAIRRARQILMRLFVLF
jgi:fructose-1,6-bisphosphatase I